VSNKFVKEFFNSDKKLSFTYSTTPTEVTRGVTAVTATLLPQNSLDGTMLVPILDDKSELGHGQ